MSFRTTSNSFVKYHNLKTKYDKLIFVVFLLVLVTYPFSIAINSITIVSLVVCSLFKLIKEKEVYFDKVYLLFLLFFLTRVLSLLYTSNMSSGGRAIERSLPLLILPLIFLISRPIFSRIFFFLKVLNMSTLVTCLYCLYRNYYHFVSNNIPLKWWLDWKYNSYHLSEYIDFGANYFSLLIVLNLVGTYFYKEASKKIKILYWGNFAIQLFFLILLSSRSMLLFFVLSSFVILVAKMYQIYKLRGAIAMAFLLYLGIVMAHSSFPVLRQRYKKTYLELVARDDYKNTQVGGLVNRILKTKSAINIIKDHYIWGVGIGDVKDELKKQYVSIDFDEGIDHSFDAHNQYLQSYLASGIFGVLSFMMLILFLFISFLQKKQYMSLFIVLLYAYFSLFESFIETHKGVVLFSTLMVLILSDKKDNTNILASHS